MTATNRPCRTPCRVRTANWNARTCLAHAHRLALLQAVNNTNIGLLYIGTALLFFVLAGILAS
jgi:hypothetical protein